MVFFPLNFENNNNKININKIQVNQIKCNLDYFLIMLYQNERFWYIALDKQFSLVHNVQMKLLLQGSYACNTFKFPDFSMTFHDPILENSMTFFSNRNLLSWPNNCIPHNGNVKCQSSFC